MNEHQKSPISFYASILRLPRKGMPVVLEPDDAERARLAQEHDLLSLDRFRADMLVEPWKGDGVRVSGEVSAHVTQACVVTLEPVESEVHERIDALFIPEHSPLARYESDPSGELLIDPEGPDAPEIFTGDKIDVGALAEEFFALGIDPYPRKSAPDGETVHGDKSFRDETESPFARLAALKTKL